MSAQSRTNLEEVPRAVSLPARSSVFRRRPSLIWLVPLLAVLTAAALAIWVLLQRGPTVTITFATAEGLEAHKTAIKYKSVDIGMIKRIELLEDRSGVQVTAELSRQMAGLLVDDARFWVVRPRVSMAGVSGIGTLFSGVHLGFDAGASTTARRSFVGLENPPHVVDRPGRRFVLRADNIGSLDVGAPLYLRRFQVGQVTSVELDAQGAGVQLEVFVNAPYDRLVTSNTRFWNASGVDLTVNARGIKLDTQSVASVLSGGIAFQTPDADSSPAENPTAAPGTAAAPAGTAAATAGAEFTLFATRDLALRTPRNRSSIRSESYVLTFKQPVRGLAAGASVQLLGMDVGEVARVDVEFDPRTADPLTEVTINLQPDRLRIRGTLNAAQSDQSPRALPAQATRDLLDRLVQRGLRAQVRTENLLTGQRYVAFDFVPGASGGKLDWSQQPPQLPTSDASGDDLQAAVIRILAKLEKLPTDQLAKEAMTAVQQMKSTFEGTSKLMAQLDTQLVPQMGSMLLQARKTLGSVEQTLSSEAPLQQDLRRTLRDLGAAGQALRTLSEYLERHPESLLRGKKED